MAGQQTIELKQRIASLEVEIPNFQNELKNQQQNVRMGTAAIFISCCLIFFALIGLIILPFAIKYRKKAVKMRDDIEKKVSDSVQSLITAKKELVLLENPTS